VKIKAFLVKLSRIIFKSKQKVPFKCCDNCIKRSKFIDNGVSLISKEGAAGSNKRLCKEYSQLVAFECQQANYKYWKGSAE